jgi:hypothetical protein
VAPEPPAVAPATTPDEENEEGGEGGRGERGRRRRRRRRGELVVLLYFYLLNATVEINMYNKWIYAHKNFICCC